MATNTFEIEIRPDSSMFQQLGHLSVDISDSFKEFIDNSYSSYVDHELDLVRAGHGCCVIKVTWNDDELVIADNAFGMDKDNFSRAFCLNGRNENATERSRNEYGMGLKYAAMSLGDKLTVETIAFNSGLKYTGTLDASYLNDTREEKITCKEESVQKDYHGTRIKITGLKTNYKFSNFMKGKKNISALIKTLKSIYSNDLRTGIVKISINGEPVEYEKKEYMINQSTGSQEILPVSGSFEYDGKTYTFKGTVGWLKTGSVDDGGIYLIQKNRVVVKSYRPEEYFGKSNDARQQRIYGEIELLGDSWPISFTKNDFNWDGELEDKFNKEWYGCDGVKDLIDRAKKYKAREQNITVTQLAKSSAVDNLSKLSEDSREKDKPKSGKPAKKVDDKPENTVKKPEDNSGITAPKTVTEETFGEEIGTDRTISYKGIDYKLTYIPKEDDDMADRLFRFTRIKDNEFKIYLNTNASFFKKYKTVESKSLIDNLVSAVFLGEMSSRSMGVSAVDIEKINNSINEVIKLMGGK